MAQSEGTAPPIAQGVLRHYYISKTGAVGTTHPSLYDPASGLPVLEPRQSRGTPAHRDEDFPIVICSEDPGKEPHTRQWEAGPGSRTATEFLPRAQSGVRGPQFNNTSSFHVYF